MVRGWAVWRTQCVVDRMQEGFTQLVSEVPITVSQHVDRYRKACTYRIALGEWRFLCYETVGQHSVLI